MRLENKGMLKGLITQKEYEGIAGADWPSYEDYAAGHAQTFVYTEIENILRQTSKIIPLSLTYQQPKIPQVAYDYVMNSHPRGANSKHKITNSCNRPWKTVTIDMFTNCMICVCDGWLPKPVGKITDFKSLEDIWTNETAVKLQQNILDKEFTWCAVEHCGVKLSSNFETSYQMVFGIDDSCNLKCPSCRRDTRMYDSGPLFEIKIQAVKHAINLLAKFDSPIHITLACSGDPLASLIYRPFLHAYVPKPNQTFTLFTNGLLLKKQLHKTLLLNNITEFRISIDAATKQTYEKVRLGGNWEILIENLNYLKEQNLNHLMNLMFVVQKKNFRDIPKFIELCKYYNCRGKLTQLDDWGTWVNENIETPDSWTLQFGTYFDNNVLDVKHTNHKEFIDIIKSIEKDEMSKVSISPRLHELLK